jgi:hypothetical protein
LRRETEKERPRRTGGLGRGRGTGKLHDDADAADRDGHLAVASAVAWGCIGHVLRA